MPAFVPTTDDSIPAAPGPALCIVGAGPTGIGVLERLAANAAELSTGSRVTVHLVDPHPPLAGSGAPSSRTCCGRTRWWVM